MATQVDGGGSTRLIQPLLALGVSVEDKTCAYIERQLLQISQKVPILSSLNFQNW